jgi:hypothetical protein
MAGPVPADVEEGDSVTLDEIRTAMDDPVAQRLLNSANPARLGYVARDGTPRVVPVGFH